RLPLHREYDRRHLRLDWQRVRPREISIDRLLGCGMAARSVGRGVDVEDLPVEIMPTGDDLASAAVHGCSHPGGLGERADQPGMQIGRNLFASGRAESLENRRRVGFGNAQQSARFRVVTLEGTVSTADLRRK